MMAMTSSSVHRSSRADVTTTMGGAGAFASAPPPLVSSRRARVKALACGLDCTYSSGTVSRSNILAHSRTASCSSGSCASDVLMLEPSRSRRTPCSTTARDRRRARSATPLSGAARTRAVRSLSSGWRKSEASMPVRDIRRRPAGGAAEADDEDEADDDEAGSDLLVLLLLVPVMAENAEHGARGRRTRTAAAVKKISRSRRRNDGAL
mmetsp:Transcript_26593/g.76811  ORF Transcript_26593/g.76811 Transcript_26593/m.76811 type:complete len:208 (-) Transcript_26593:200-823(-)